jgi:hypothetical protein
MSALAWYITLGIAGWIVIAVITGLAIGRVIRRRDEQVPRIPDDGQDMESLAWAVRETKLGREHDAHFAAWQQELRGKS